MNANRPSEIFKTLPTRDKQELFYFLAGIKVNLANVIGKTKELTQDDPAKELAVLKFLAEHLSNVLQLSLLIPHPPLYDHLPNPTHPFPARVGYDPTLAFLPRKGGKNEKKVRGVHAKSRLAWGEPEWEERISL